MIYSPDRYPALLERPPVALRTDPRAVGARDDKGTPFLVKKCGANPLESHERNGAYFVHMLFLYCLWRSFGEDVFQRGNLDAKRLGYLLSDGVLQIINEDLDDLPASTLRINRDRAEEEFPCVFR